MPTAIWAATATTRSATCSATDGAGKAIANMHEAGFLCGSRFFHARILMFCSLQAIFSYKKRCFSGTLSVHLHIPCRLPRLCGAVGWDDIWKEGVYLTPCLWLFKTSHLLISVKEQGNGRCLRDMLIAVPCPTCGVWKQVIYISAWASALLVLQRWATRRP